MALALGIVTPVLHMNPRFDPPEWEVTAGVDDVVRVVQEAEKLGYDWVACSEHIAIPSVASSVRGGRYFDPFSTLGYFAAKTSRVGLLTHMAVLPYHHPLELVKRLGTLDVLSGGRVIAGVGVGSLQPEFEVLGHAFDGTGRAVRRRHPGHPGRLGPAGARVPRDALRLRGVHRGALGTAPGARGLGRGPHAPLTAPRPRAGGRLDALRLQDRPAHGAPDQPHGARRPGPRTPTSRGRPLKLILAPEPPIDPLGDPERTTEFLASYVAIGATGLQRALRPPLAGALLRADGGAEVGGGGAAGF